MTIRSAFFAVLFPLAVLLCAPGGASAQQKVTPERVHDCLDEFLVSSADLLPRAEIRFRSLDLPSPFDVPAGVLSCEVLPSDRRILPSRRFTVIFRVDGRVAQNISIRAELEAIAPVVVAASELSRGSVLSANDLNLVERDITGLRNPCFDPQELIGKQMRRSVRLGEPLDRAAIEFPPTIRRGEVVTIVAGRDGFMLTATGLARQDGNEGETIMVRNSSSQRDVFGRVAGPGTVEVEF